ncbi:MAG: 3-phosphoshikimate 1-carboxyvinyltransferase, partial [Bacteroidota bacterium]
MKTIRIVKPDRILQGSINLPASKSISNRLLIMQALCGNEFPLVNLSKASDTVLLQKLLNRIKATAGSRDAVEL